MINEEYFILFSILKWTQKTTMIMAELIMQSTVFRYISIIMF